MKHAFDIDGVVTDHSVLLNCLQEQFPSVKLEHLTVYDIPKAMKIHGFLGDESELDNVEFFNHYATEIYGKSTENKGFLNYYNTLIDQGEDVYFITARPSNKEYLTKGMFEQIGITYNNVFHVGSPDEKHNMLSKIKPDYFYEDKVETLIKFKGLYGKGVLFDYPYNQQINVEEYGIIRIKDWNELN